MRWSINRVYAFVFGIIYLAIGIIGFLTPTENSTGVQAVFGIFDVDFVHNVLYVTTGLAGIIAATMGNARNFNQVFGAFYLLLGLLGLVPSLYRPAGSYNTDKGLFIGLMHLNAGDHILHIVTGVIALIIGFLMANAAEHHPWRRAVAQV
jgi:Domain of unknown function (DUF4383)